MASVDSPEDNRTFATEQEADFPILSDPAKTVAASYGVLGPAGLPRRWTFYIDPDGRIAAIEKGVSPASAGRDMAATLERLRVRRAACDDGGGGKV
jgi:peroxiredoxin Q/BCP